MTSDEFKNILYDLHRKNEAKIDEIRKDIHELKLAFNTHESSVRMLAIVFGVIGSSIFTAAIAFGRYLIR